MADIRCPMCGNLNSAEAEICQFCQARLKPLSISPEPGPSQENFSPSEPTEAASSISDWLDSLRSEDDEPSAENVEEDSEWILEEPEDKEEQIVPGDEDWLAEFRNNQDEDEVETQDAEDLQQTPLEEEPTSEEVVPDWLAELRSTSDQGESPGGQEGEREEPGATDEEPDWLRELRTGEESPESIVETPKSEDSYTTEEEIPAWLAAETKPEDLEIQAEDLSSEQQYGVPEEPTEEEPQSDWLGGMAAQETESLDEELPDWLKELKYQGETPKGDEENLAFVEPESEEAETDKTGEPGEEVATPEEEIETEYSGWLVDIGETPEPQQMGGEEEESLDWLENISEPQSQASLSDAGQETVYPEWLEGLGEETELPVPSSEEGEADIVGSSIPPFTAGIDDLAQGIPDWLEQIPEQETDKETVGTEKEKPEVEPTNLPDWLEAIRPEKTTAPSAPVFDESDKRVENAGPLMGMQGALPAEPDIARQKPSPSYSVRINVSEKQKSQAELIERILGSEGEPKPLASRLVIRSQTVFRIVVFVLLFLAVLVPLATGTPRTPLPMYPPQTYDFSQEIGQLPGGAPVLLAFDYSPGLSGEIDTISAIVIDHLMVKGAHIAIVSTVPTGPLQAERLIGQVNRNGGHNYQVNDQFVDIGYVPGGQSGLLALAENPRQVMPYDLRGNMAWEFDWLKDVQRLSDFSLILVMTESPGVARAWIEQVQPLLGDTPLIMATSAQVEPVIQPYYAATPKQIAGMISGLSQGASYERLIPRPGLASQFWGSYSLANLLAVVLVILGSAVSLGTYLVSLRKYGRLEEDG